MSVSREAVLEFIETINKDHVQDVVDQSCDFLSFFEEDLEIKALEKDKQTGESPFLNRKNSKYNSMKMICQICDGKANGIHYGLLTCEGCKGFFRRSIRFQKHYSCRTGKKDCEIRSDGKRKCCACRLKKCLSFGMNYDLVLNKEQIMKRRKAVEFKMKRITAFSAPSLSQNELIAAQKLTEKLKQELTMKIAPEELSHYYDFFDIKSKNLRIQIQNNDFFINKSQLIHLAELTNLFFCSIIRFMKNIPEFIDLRTNNQVKIIQSSIVELLIINLVQYYDEKQNALVIGNSSYHLEHMKNCGFPTEELEKCLRTMNKKKLIETEIALVMIIVIFSEDRGCNNAAVLETQEHYAFLLQKILEQMSFNFTRFPFPELIFQLSTIRRLSTKSRPYLEAIISQCSEFLPPMLSELVN